MSNSLVLACLFAGVVAVLAALVRVLVVELRLFRGPNRIDWRARRRVEERRAGEVMRRLVVSGSVARW